MGWVSLRELWRVLLAPRQEGPTPSQGQCTLGSLRGPEMGQPRGAAGHSPPKVMPAYLAKQANRWRVSWVGLWFAGASASPQARNKPRLGHLPVSFPGQVTQPL